MTLGILLSTKVHAVMPDHIFRLAEIKSTKETSSLPPNLEVTFDLACDESFVKVIRHEDTKNGKLVIAVGVLVEKDTSKKCKDPSKETTVSAGPTYSGRAFEISLIHQ